MTDQSLDLQAALPAILETASNYRTACDEFEEAKEESRTKLTAKMQAVLECVSQGRALGLDMGDPFENADPIGYGLALIRLTRHQIVLTCNI